MERKSCYRHELKYEISYAEYLSLRQNLSCVMSPDPHAHADGKYRICSIYFDNLYDKALREKMDGVPLREKFRIRYYNDDFRYILLEKKEKHDRLCKKSSAILTREQCEDLLSQRIAWMQAHESPIVKELYVKMRTELLKPRILVSYLREAYLYAAGNVRITFDSGLRTSLYRQNLLAPCAYDISVADAPQFRILEIKYDHFLPEVIACLAQTGIARQQAFSKYGICRRFG